MKPLRATKQGMEAAVLVGLLAGLALSVVLVARQVAAGNARIAAGVRLSPQQRRGAAAPDVSRLEAATAAMEQPHRSAEADRGLLVSELRVVAMGSAYPIPYEAEVCPFSNIPQPAMNQLDRDGDGITDDWELEYGFDRFNAADAAQDADADGFSNREEFAAKTDPTDSESHPPYITKLRFVERRDVPLPVVFQGASELPGGQMMFQLNTPSDGNTYFKAIGEDMGEDLRNEIDQKLKKALKGIVIQRYEPAADIGDVEKLVLSRRNAEIVLEKGKITPDPESEALLINILDRGSIIATMGALLSLSNDVYAVQDVLPDRVVVKHIESGEKFGIVGLAEGECDSLPEDLE
ncbi:Amuc_1099 family pilus-like system protein [Pontiella sp.]|uniref:Amuc_1099 family pilus-like system protein n=1 Tax=Pontiella sp. TaxID=2837462 RepID=UPI003564FE65